MLSALKVYYFQIGSKLYAIAIHTQADKRKACYTNIRDYNTPLSDNVAHCIYMSWSDSARFDSHAMCMTAVLHSIRAHFIQFSTSSFK